MEDPEEQDEKQDEKEPFEFYSELGNMEDIDLVSFAYQITSGMVNNIITFLAAFQYHYTNALVTIMLNSCLPLYQCIYCIKQHTDMQKYQ